MVISPDGKLMVATGDIFNEKNAQDTESVSGKILRLNIDGSVPDDNPVKGSPMWAMGFRVPQGLVYSEKGNLYSAEHGDATDDEVNLITKGSNYGYPNVTGACDSLWEKDFCNEHGVKEPLRSWTPTIAPSGIDYYGNNAIPEWKNSLLAATLKTQSLRVLKLNDEGNSITADRVMFENRFGRLRDVLVSPDGDVYLSTSNRDWNPGPGFPLKEDDRIIRVFALDDDGIKSFVRDPQDGLPIKNTVGDTSNTGQIMYLKYCASCHKADGKGVEGSFPSLRESPILYGQKDKLIAMVLVGSGSGEASRKQQYDQQMPSFSFMPDSEIAGILNYVRREFGNMQEKLFPGDVRKTRLTLSLPGNRK
jgi:mono/diheme cytochrome c family protein